MTAGFGNVEADEIEVLATQRGPQWFVRLCNCVLWASSNLHAVSLPTLTERSGRDGGVDAEWIHQPAVDFPLPIPLLRAGRNVYQYKWRTRSSYREDNLVSSLGLRGALGNLAPPPPTHYVVFTNLHLNKAQCDELESQVRWGAAEAADALVTVVHAASLAASLNDLPHVRAAFLEADRFTTWMEAYEQHLRQSLGPVRMIGREAELKQMGEVLADPIRRVIHLMGPPGSGKSRLALEALRHHESDVAVALDPAVLRPSRLDALRRSGQRPLLLVDGIEADASWKAAFDSLQKDGLRVLILSNRCDLPAGISLSDDRVCQLGIDGLGFSDASQLLQENGPRQWSFVQWALEHVGTRPGILLAVNRSHEDLSLGSHDLIDQIGRRLEEEVVRGVGPQGPRVLGVYSVLTEVGVEGPCRFESELLCEALQVPTDDAERARPALEEKGYLIRHGGFVAVHPPMLAERLAEGLFRARPELVPALLAALPEGAVTRLLDRLVAVDCGAPWWNALLGADIFSTAPAAARRLPWLRRIASVAPGSVVEVVKEHFPQWNAASRPVPVTSGAGWDEALRRAEQELADAGWPLTEGEHKEIASLLPRADVGRTHGEGELLPDPGTLRRDLVMLLQDLLEYLASGTESLRMLAQLAVNDPETWANNAAGVFCSAFSPHQPTVAVSLRRRLEILRDLDWSDSAQKELALRACRAALDRAPWIWTAKRAHRPDEVRLRPSGRDMAEYFKEVAGWLVEQHCARLGDRDAWSQVPAMLVELAAHCGAPGTLKHLERLAEVLREAPVQIPVSPMLDAVAELRRGLRLRLEEAASDEEKQGVTSCLERCDVLDQKIGDADWQTRLKVLVGPPGWFEFDEKRRLKALGWFQLHRERVEAVAKEAAGSPDLVDEGLFLWLLSREAPRTGAFWQFLGRHAGNDVWLHRLVEKLAQPSGPRAVAEYCRGWAEREPEAVERYLSSVEDLPASVIVHAINLVPPSDVLGRRVVDLAGSLSVEEMYHTLSPDWTRRLPRAGAEVLMALLSKGPLGAGLALSHLAQVEGLARREAELEPLVEVAWRCLESPPGCESTLSEFHADVIGSAESLASSLAPGDPDRAFALFAKLLRMMPERYARALNGGAPVEYWNPIDRNARLGFYDALIKTNANRAVATLLDAELPEEYAWMIWWHASPLLGREELKEPLRLYAQASEENAVRVARCLHRGQSFFWELADFLLAGFETCQPLRQALFNGLVKYGIDASFEDPSVRDEVRRDAIRRSTDLSLSFATREWLSGVADQLSHSRRGRAFRDNDVTAENIDELIQGPDTKERRLAVVRLLTRDRWEDVRNRLSVRDIEEALPDLPEHRRKVLQSALRVWTGDRR